MKISRRDFQIALGLSFLSLTTTKLHAFKNRGKSAAGIPILQGATCPTSTQLSILGVRDRPYFFEVIDLYNSQTIKISEQLIYKKNYSDWLNYHLVIEDLQLDREYQLNVYTEIDGQIVDTRKFKTLNLEQAQLNWVFGSCMFEGRHQKSIWDSLYAQKPDFIIFLGDTVYIDRKWGGSAEVSEERIWGRHIQARLVLDIYYWPELIPVIATWDDHDFGLNDANRTFSFKEESREIFDIFFPCYENDFYTRGPGVAKKISTFGQEFYLLDNRTFRSENLSSSEEYFGEKQLQWLEESIDRKKLTWLMQGSQWTTPYDKTENFQRTHNRAYLHTFNRLKSLNAKFVLCSGDVHFSEICRIPDNLLGYESMELTSSSIHSRSVPGYSYLFKNPQRLVGTGAKNFLFINSTNKGTYIEGDVTSFSANNQIMFKMDLDKVKF
ncbi:MAG: alkaline phosphatase family protein [Bdellovibrionales bacterium]|nr:alkaline phosphatase family protein [Bdellovibrionales bacterium]